MIKSRKVRKMKADAWLKERRTPMSKYEFPVLIEKDEDGIFIASVPSLKGCHTQAKTIPVLLKRIKEAIRLCLDVKKIDRPPLKFIGLHEVEITTK